MADTFSTRATLIVRPGDSLTCTARAVRKWVEDETAGLAASVPDSGGVPGRHPVPSRAARETILPARVFRIVSPLGCFRYRRDSDSLIVAEMIGPEISLTGAALAGAAGAGGEEDFEEVDYGAHVEIEFFVTKKLAVYLRNYFGLQYNGETMILQTQTTTELNRLNILGVGVSYYLK